jgi:hypothetical protein
VLNCPNKNLAEFNDPKFNNQKKCKKMRGPKGMGGHHSNTTQRHLKGLVTPFFEVSWGCPSYVQKGTSNAAFVET